MCRLTYDILAAGRTPTEIEVPADRAAEDALLHPERPRVLGRRGPPAPRQEPGGTERPGADRRCRIRHGDEPEAAAVNMSLDDLREERSILAAAGTPRADHLAARARSARAGVHGDLRRRSRRRAARRVHRSIPEAIRVRGAARRPHRRRRRGVGLAGPTAPQRRVQRGVGRPSSEYGFEPTRFDEMRRGAWDVDARVADMDIDGVWASLCFPSFLPGFVGNGSRCGPTPMSSRSPRCARTTTGTSKRGAARIPIASCRTRSRTCATPRSRRRRSGATPSAASRR